VSAKETAMIAVERILRFRPISIPQVSARGDTGCREGRRHVDRVAVRGP
jgi:hypothetical protein